MTDTDNQQRFTEYYGLANRIIDVMEKDKLADVARLLAVQVTLYQERFGKLFMEETVRLLDADTVTDAEVGTLADAMQLLTSLLGLAAGLVDDDPDARSLS